MAGLPIPLPAVVVTTVGELTSTDRRALLKRLVTDGLAARAAYDAFLKKWTPLCPPVARALEEAGLELLTEGDVEVVAHDQRVRESQS